jgi:hypothetical protein
VDVGLRCLGDDALSGLSTLRVLDVRDNPLTCVSRHGLRGLDKLTTLYADNPKLCCGHFLPSPSVHCHAPADELSPCSDLLAHDFFRAFLWALSFLALLGNAGVLYYRACVEQMPQSSFRVLVMNLCVADLLMGVHMLVIGVADAVYRGAYVEWERRWTSRAACQAAGFLSFVSCEVSAFVLCLITLDRVLAICLPFSPHLHLDGRAAVGLCVGVWVLGVVMATVPLAASMEFYGQNGICLPLPIMRHEFAGHHYAFAVFICLNFVLFLLIGAGQLAIYRAVRRAGSRAGRVHDGKDVALTRRLLMIAATDFLCWFPIGLLGLLAKGGVSIPGVVNVWTAIFVLPFNSALNPFLYTLNGLMDSWNKRRAEAQTRRLLGRLQVSVL